MPNKIEHCELEKIMPHSRKMLLIGEVEDFDAENWKIRTKTKIGADCIFFDETAGGVPNYALIEFAAQSVAALLGAVSAKSKKMQRGFILSATNFSFAKNIAPLNSDVLIFAEKVEEIGSAFSFFAEVKIGEEEICSGSLTVMVGE